MNNRGDFNISRKLIYFIIYIFLIGFIFVYAVALQGGKIDVPFDDIDEFNDKLIVNRLFESKDCFAYEENGRVYTWVLDSSKFDEKVLKNCLYYGDYGYKRQIKITLNYLDDEKIIYNTNRDEIIKKDDWINNNFERYILVDNKYPGNVRIELS